MSEQAYVYGHNERVGLRKLNVTDPRFRFFAWECVGTDSVKLTGCVVTRTITRGPRKGQPSYDKPHVVAVVTEAERTQERERWEAETGHCGECLGSGQVMKRWNHITGTEYRPCTPCGGSGRVAGAA